MELSDEVRRRFKNWLLYRETDIASGLEDLGELREVFVEVFGREPIE